MKISVIMQSYLGDYPGARSNPKYKFVRAVNSFLLQKHPDKELVIVSDGCEDTKALYESCFSSFSNIKFAYVGRGNLPRTYETRDNKKYFRGLPREIGRTLADGEIITYMDSDDIILPSRLTALDSAWSNADVSKIWAYNTMVVQPMPPSAGLATESTIDLRLFGFPIDEPMYSGYMSKPGFMIPATVALSHRASAKAKWQDTFHVLDANGKRITGRSEDHEFVGKLETEAPGCKHDSPTYVVCHYKGDPSCPGGWDI